MTNTQHTKQVQCVILVGVPICTTSVKINDKPRDYVEKQRHHLPTKVGIVKAVVFPVVMYGCESWTVKKSEHRRIVPLNCGAGEDS